MHELSICRAIAAIVAEHAGGQRVAQVHLDIGHLRQVVPETLRFNWEMIVIDTELAGSTLEINHVPVVLACRTCNAVTTADSPRLRCPCGSSDVELTSGEELLVTSLDLSGAA